MTTPSSRTRSEAIRDSQHGREDIPVAVAGQWISLPSGNPAFKVGVGWSVATVPNRYAYRGSVVPQRRLVEFENRLWEDGRWETALDEEAREGRKIVEQVEAERDPDDCGCRGLYLCSKHSWEYQRHYGRAFNE